MNVVFVINDLSYFAIHRHALAVAWLDRGWHVTVMTGTSQDPSDKLDPRLTIEPLPFARHRLAPWRDVVCMFKVHRRTGTDRADVVHAFTIKAVLLTGLSAILHRRKTGLVLTFAGLGKIFEPSDALWSKFRRTVTTAILRQIEKRCMPWTTFENQHDCSRAIGMGFASAKRSKVVQGAGIDFSQFKRPVQARKGPLRVVMASRLITTKGVDTFLEAARRLNGKAEFTLTGMRDSQDAAAVNENVLSQAAQEGTINLRAATPMAEMGALFREHDVAVLPTRLKEGFPRSLLEAAACGCALIATKQDVIEQVVRSGETGWLLEEPNADNLVHAMEYALREPDTTRRMGRNAAALVSSMRVDTASVAEDIQSVYMLALNASTESGCKHG